MLGSEECGIYIDVSYLLKIFWSDSENVLRLGVICIIYYDVKFIESGCGIVYVFDSLL